MTLTEVRNKIFPKACVPMSSSFAILNVSPNGGSTLLYHADNLTSIIRQQVVLSSMSLVI